MKLNIEKELEEERKLSDPNITEKERAIIYYKSSKRDMKDDLFSMYSLSSLLYIFLYPNFFLYINKGVITNE